MPGSKMIDGLCSIQFAVMRFPLFIKRRLHRSLSESSFSRPLSGRIYVLFSLLSLRLQSTAGAVQRPTCVRPCRAAARRRKRVSVAARVSPGRGPRWSSSWPNRSDTNRAEPIQREPTDAACWRSDRTERTRTLQNGPPEAGSIVTSD